MAQPVIQTSFNAGEFAPALNARVDLAKYHSAAALLKNFFVDYRGGASSRPGTKYIIQCLKSATPVRLISFQASFSVSYILELGDFYMRFVSNGSPVLETAYGITAATKANPAVLTIGTSYATAATANNGAVSASYAPGDTVTATGGTGVATAAVVTVASTKVLSATVNAGGSGGTNGTQTVTGTTGTGTPFQASVTVSGGAITAVLSITVAGAYTANPTVLTQEPVTGASLVGAKLSVLMGVNAFTVTTPGSYVTFPANPVAQGSTSGTGVGVTMTFTTATYAISPGDWIYVSGVGGMTQLNGNYYKVSASTATTVTLADLNGVAINSTGYTTFTSGGTIARVYTIATPWAAADLALLKFALNVSNMIFTHPNYSAQLLTLISATNWTLAQISYGSTISSPTAFSNSTTLAGSGAANYAYVVTSVDINGQESAQSAVQSSDFTSRAVTGNGTNTLSWTAIPGAVSYNIYKAQWSITTAIPTGAAYGFVGNVVGVSWQDTIILTNGGAAPDYSITPQIAKNPFLGAGVQSITVTTPGTYTTVPGVTIAAPPSGSAATAGAVLSVSGTPTTGGTSFGGYSAGNQVVFSNGVVLVVATVNGFGQIQTFRPITYPGSSAGSISSGSTPSNPINSNDGQVLANLVWSVSSVRVQTAGAGYTSVPAVTFSAGAAAATAVLGDASAGNPFVPAYHQQRLCLAGQTVSPQEFNFSQPGSYFNFNTTNPVQPDNAISGNLVSTQLNTIKSLVSMPTGLIVLSDKAAWLINNGSGGSAITASDIVANSHSYNGASDVPPIVANFDILYVQSKGSSVRDLTYNFYANIFTGTDISVLSSHLFFGYTVNEWAWAEEPFKVVWAVRSDGTMLTLTYLKEQELIGWSHSTTGPNDADDFKSVATVTETVNPGGSVDAVYTVVQRTINGNVVQYIERVAERIFPNGATDAWCVDAGIQYSGAPATTFQGAQHLAGATVTGLADGIVIPSFIMPTNGNFTLGTAASKVTVGLPFTPQLQTLAIDLGEPTVQGKMKSIPSVTVRVQETLGLSIGKTFSSVVPMKDLVRGNVGSASNTVVTDLVTGDAMTKLDPSWTVAGQYCITQPYPLPASILGVIPTITVGDSK